MLLQNNFINNALTNDLKKACKTALYGKIKERTETGVAWLIGAHIQSIDTLPFNCNNAT